jgi:hypothetical protein
MIERYLTDKVNIVFILFSTFDVKILFVVETKARKLKVELSLSAKIRNLNLEDNQRATFLCVRSFQKIPSSFFFISIVSCLSVHFFLFLFFTDLFFTDLFFTDLFFTDLFFTDLFFTDLFFSALLRRKLNW